MYKVLYVGTKDIVSYNM